MNDGTGGRGRRSRSRSRRAGALAAAVAGIAVLAAACGGGSSAAAGLTAAGSTPYQKALAYAQCVRSHGVPGFPDPNSQGDFVIGPKNHVGMSSSRYQSANKACEHLLPDGGHETAAQQRKDLAAALKFTACMRAHGIPGFPDPTVNDRGVEIHGGGGFGPNAPQLQSARQACQSLLAGGGP